MPTQRFATILSSHQKEVEVEQNHNPALVHMEVAQDEIATYAMLLNRAQSSLTASWQAFERANKNSLTNDYPVKKQLAVATHNTKCSRPQ